MDKQVQLSGIKDLDVFLDSISITLNSLQEQNKETQELQAFIDSDSKDYHYIQSIVDIIISLPDNDLFAPFKEIKKELIFIHGI